jgi:valyl-tRNA synthetase
MIMFGMEMMGDVPFRQVHIHGLVRDAERQKMSKTKGNTIDPLVINDKYGTDAVRFGLLVAAAPGNDIALSEELIARGRNFANKIWNASRLLFSKPQSEPKRESLADRWIGDRLDWCAEQTNRAFKDHRYHEAADAIWTFFWDEFCDWYLELKKCESDWGYAYEVHEKALLLLHPLMPFLTEELWHRRGHETSIALEPYPQFGGDLRDRDAANAMEVIQAIVTEIRQRRAANKVARNEILKAALRAPGSVYERALSNKDAIERLANVILTVDPGNESPYLLVLDIPIDRTGLERDNEQLQKVIANSKRQLENDDFIQKAPAKVVDSIRAKLAEYEAQLSKNRAALGE